MEVTKEYQMQIKRHIVEMGHGKGINISPERITIEELENLIRVVIDVATQEDMVHKYPANWKQAVKERFFPKWLKKYYPVQYAFVWAIHKYPEVAIPDLGKEFVSFKILNTDNIT